MDNKLTMDDMTGGCITISSLGNISGKFFTPIINAPEVAILGVSKIFKQIVEQMENYVPKVCCQYLYHMTIALSMELMQLNSQNFLVKLLIKPLF